MSRTQKNPSSLTLVALLLLTLVPSTFLAAPAGAQTNETLMQYFHWYLDVSDNLWLKVSNEADDLAAVGVTTLWLPPAYKAVDVDDVGYGTYDLYDLGEFSQKGSVRTKYGYKNEYLNAITTAQANGIEVLGDVVLNHKGGADSTEPVLAIRVDPNNRNTEWGSDVMIDAWTSFDFPGRGTTHSPFKWRWYHFDGTDWAQNLQESNTVYKFRGLGKAWDWEVHTEFGNYDYLLFADVDFEHSDVVAEYEDWGVWYVNETGVDGFRLDAVKHIKYDFWNGWLDHVRSTTGKELFTVAEHWTYNVSVLEHYLDVLQNRAWVFDAPLHLNFFNASNGGGGYDMRNIWNGTLVASRPERTVTLVENHDTQPLQALESPVMDWFKPLAYAMILLRQDGLPMVFYADYYGANYQGVSMASHKFLLDIMMQARRDHAYGSQIDYFDHWDIVGWTRHGDAQHPQAMAVILTDGPGGSKWMDTGKANATFSDITGHQSGTVTTDGNGWGQFTVAGGSVSIWVESAGSPPPPPPSSVSAHFFCQNGTTFWGQNVYVIGSIPELGNWDPASAILLSPNNYPTWDGVVSNLPASTAVQWKCIKKYNGQVEWQSGANNSFTTPSSGSVNATGSF